MDKIISWGGTIGCGLLKSPFDQRDTTSLHFNSLPHLTSTFTCEVKRSPARARHPAVATSLLLARAHNHNPAAALLFPLHLRRSLSLSPSSFVHHHHVFFPAGTTSTHAIRTWYHHPHTQPQDPHHRAPPRIPRASPPPRCLPSPAPSAFSSSSPSPPSPSPRSSPRP